MIYLIKNSETRTRPSEFHFRCFIRSFIPVLVLKNKNIPVPQIQYLIHTLFSIKISFQIRYQYGSRTKYINRYMVILIYISMNSIHSKFIFGHEPNIFLIYFIEIKIANLINIIWMPDS